MRFAYIDSNGNEVPIPSVDALALRIELGAINENTELYDAQADQWGPAHTHEIFHSLSRAAGDDEGFIAPPPVVPLPTEDPEPEPVAEPEPLSEPEPEPVAEVEEASTDLGDLRLTLAEPDEALEGDDGGLTLAEELEREEEPAEDAESGMADVGLGLAPASEPIEVEDEAMAVDLTGAEPAAESGSEIEGMSGGFDFGDMDGGLEVESSFEGPDEPLSVESQAMDLSGGDLTPDLGGGDPSPDFSGGMELDSPMEFGAGAFDAGTGGSLELEAPMSDFSPEAPPAWMEPDGPDAGGGDDVMDFSAVGSESDGDGASKEVPLRDRRTPRNQPSAPKHRRERSLAGPIAGVVVLLAIGVGGYVTWPILNRIISGSDQPDAPAVFIPDIPAELMPQMRDAAERALAVTFADVRRGWAASDPVMAPSADWLSGAYLANASQFDNVEAFWIGMEDFLDGVRAVDLAAFDAAYQAQLQDQADADAAAMRERADSGFVAGAPDRSETYAKVRTLTEAALALHAFLVANESNIAYVPALTATTDPVLEASPGTPEIREAMEDMIDEVTGGLAALGYQDLVTADGLWARVLTEVQETGVR